MYVGNAELEFQKKIDSLEDRFNKCSASLQTQEKDLDEIFKPDSSRITPLAEKAFTVIYRQKVALSKDGYVYANKPHGKPAWLLNIPKTTMGSSTASSSSVRKRSSIVEKVLADVSGAKRKTPTSLDPDHVMQQASLINRNKDFFCSVC